METNKKLKTGIDGLDKIFYGGIRLMRDEANEENLVILTRGEHGVNKIYLAMQICESLNQTLELNRNATEIKSNKKQAVSDGVGEKKVRFLSLNKDKQRLRDVYYDFYVHRLIRGTINGRAEDLRKLSELGWKKITTQQIKINGVGEFLEDGNSDEFVNRLKEGVIYYSDRTHGFHVRVQDYDGDDEETLLCTRIDNDEDKEVEFVGKKELNGDTASVDGLTTFYGMLRDLERIEGGPYNCIMVDGLSCLSDEEIGQCSFQELSRLLREKCKVGIITADERFKLPLHTDIIIDLSIKESPDNNLTYHALKVSKCLYQKNAYGWHRYKMRNFGIEVIPSLKLQMSRPYYKEDSLASSSLPVSKIPYRTWLEYNNLHYIGEGNNAYTTYKEKPAKSGNIETGHVLLLDNIKKSDDLIELNTNERDHSLLVNLSGFNPSFYSEEMTEQFQRLHCVNIYPGYMYADEFLYMLEQHVKVIARKVQLQDEKTEGYPVEMFYRYVHLIIGDINLINYEYPYLNKDGMLLPAIVDFTKRHLMTNYLFSSFNPLDKADNSPKEKDLYRQLISIID